MKELWLYWFYNQTPEESFIEDEERANRIYLDEFGLEIVYD